ncbi:hypothetical protein AX15_003430 [Amanita polypyramis BW_CC]|nr:hypothetical protein AX15_003430 [Amanita polypyramis BW_CC]
MNVVGGGSGQQQGQHPVVGLPQISRYIPVNGTVIDATLSSSSRRGSMLPLANLLNAKSYGQIQQFDTATDQEFQRQVEDFNKTVTIVLWYKAKTEPLRIQHTIRSFPLFQLSGLTSIVNGLGLADDSYLDTYNPEFGYWVQHTIHTVRLVESQQRLLYRTRKNLLEGIGEEDCTSLSTEIEIQKQLISSKTQVTSVSQSKSLESEVSAPATPNLPSASKEVSEKNSRKRLASEVHAQDFELGSPSAKVYIPNNFYLTSSHNEAASPDVASTTTTTTVLPGSVVDENVASTTNDIDPVNHAVTSTSPDYLYPSSVYYSTTPAPSSHPAETAQFRTNGSTSGAVAYNPHLPLKRWPNDYSVSEISAGFHDMDRLVAHTSNLTQRVAFERVFGSRYVKSTVCRHRGVWKRASPTVRDQFIAMGNDERALWGEFVRSVEGRQLTKAGARNGATVLSSSLDTIEFSNGAGTEDDLVEINSDTLQGQTVAENNPGTMDEPIMDSLQGPTASGPPTAESSLQNDLNVFDAPLSHIPSSQA